MQETDMFYPPGEGVVLVDGKVLPIGQNQITPAQIVEQLKTVICRKYKGKDPEKQGMTLIEAAMYSAAKSAADGDTDALEKLLNRICGKPLQQVANLNMTTTLKDFLDGIAKSENSPIDVTPADVDPFGD